MVFEKIAEILAEQLDVEVTSIKMDTDIINDLGANSLDMVDIVMSLESEFDIELADQDIEDVHTVGDVVKYLEDRA